jgi:hypothetical protein
MYILFKNVPDPELGLVKRAGSYLEYVVGYVDDTIKNIAKYEHLNPTVFDSDDVALAWKFTNNWRGDISVKRGTTANEQLNFIVSSNEADEYKVKYYLTDDDKSNAVKFTKIVIRKMLDEHFDKQLSQINGQVSSLESLSWSQQRAESNSYELDSNVSVPMLTALAEARGITVSEMSTKVQTAILEHAQKITNLLARKQSFEQEVKSCTTIDECVVFLHNRFGITMPLPFQDKLGITDPAKIDL